MKNGIIVAMSLILLSACGNTANESEKKETTTPKEDVKLTSEELESKSFTELFKTIDPKDFSENIFKIFGEDFTVITSGNADNYNSMTAGWGGVGVLFEDPAAWCFLRANRYTLEYIREEKSFTFSFFPKENLEQVLYFGQTSGRNTDKMENHTLSAVATPDGNMTYKEARLVIECDLTEISTVHPDDFYLQKGKEFIEGGFEEAKDYHKIVFGMIKNIWIKK
ncbi:MAG: flavin reductase [Bacteroidales bacterium]|jgi:flavin reductase (DIM6/NTAB) family NADH-FMN oxidoreductase RutF|nr:flavin reductase [Bacteroidales bacterium]